MPKFIPGLQLSEGYYRDIIAPLLRQEFPNLAHAAGLIGAGSEVLGLDTKMSRDHSWGPRLQLFLGEDQLAQYGEALHTCLASRLPYEYRGYPTSFKTPDPREKFVTQMVAKKEGLVDHMVEITTFAKFTHKQLGLDGTAPLSEDQWLSLPQHQLLTVTSGKIFHDGIGLGAMRETLEWYSDDVWKFLLGCTWWRFRRAEQVVGRVGILEDELGASVVAGRIVHDLMRLAFFMERKYEPYPKWQGIMFQSLKCAGRLGPQLTAVMEAKGWLARDQALMAAYETVAEMHNDLGLTKFIPPKCEEFRGRGFHVIQCDRFARALFVEVKSPRLSQLFREGLLGNIDLITDNADMNLSAVEKGRILRLFQPD